MKPYGLINYQQYLSLVESIAYYKYINGSTDSIKNWVEAELEANTIIKKASTQYNCKLTQSLL